MATSNYPRLRVKVGDPLTLTTFSGLTITGEVALIDDDPDGYGICAVAIRDDPNRADPIWVRGDRIEVWRLGEAVRAPVVGWQNGQAVPVPEEVLRNLRQQR